MSDNFEFLSAEVGLDFSKAIEEVERFQNKLKSVADTFNKVSDKAKNFSQATIEKVLNQYIEGLKGKSITVEIERRLSDTLSKKLTEELANKIEIKGLDKVQIDLGETVEKEITSYIKDAIIQKLTLTGLNKIRVPFDKTMNDVVRDRIQEKLQELFEKPGFITLGEVDTNNIKLSIEAKHLQTIVNKLRDKIIDLIASNISVEAKEDEKSSQALQSMKQHIEKLYNVFLKELEKIDTTFSEILSSFGSSVEELKTIENLGKDVKEFKSGLKTLIKDTKKLLEALSSINVKDIDTQGISQIADLISQLQGNVKQYLVEYLTQLSAKAVEYIQSIGQKDSEAQQKIKEFLNDLHNSVMKILNEYKTVIQTSISLLGDKGKAIDVLKVVQALDETIVGQLTELVNRLSSPVDNVKLQEVISTIATTSEEILTLTGETFVKYLTTLSETISNYIDKKITEIVLNVQQELKKQFEGQPETVKGRGRKKKEEQPAFSQLTEVSTKLSQAVSEGVKNSISNLISEVVKLETIKVDISEKLTQLQLEVKQKIEELFNKIIEEIAGKEVSVESLNTTISDKLKEIEQAIDTQLRKALQFVVNTINEKGIAPVEFKELGVEEITSLFKNFKDSLIENLLQLKTSLTGLNLSSEDLDTVKTYVDNISQQLKNLFNDVSEIFKDFNIKINLADFSTKFESYFNELKQTLSQLETLYDVLEEYAKRIQSIKINTERVKSTLLFIEGYIKELGDEVEIKLKQYAKDLYDYLEEAKLGLKFLEEFKVEDYISSLEKGMRISLTKFQNKVSNVENVDAEWVIGAMRNLFKLINKRIVSEIDKFKENVRQISILPPQLGIEYDIKPALEEMENRIKEEFEKLKSGLTSVINFENVRVEVENGLKSLEQIVIEEIRKLFNFESGLNEQEAGKIKESLKKDLISIIRSFSTVLKSQLNLVLASDELNNKIREVFLTSLTGAKIGLKIDLTNIESEELEKKIIKAIQENFKNIDLSNISNFEAQLNQIVEEIKVKITKEIISQIKGWTVSAGSVNIDTKIVEKVVEQVLKTAKNEILNSLNNFKVSKQSFDSIINVIDRTYVEIYNRLLRDMRQVVKQLDIASTFKVNTRNLGATVTNALARSFQVSVKDFKAAFPILEGEDTFKYIMKTLYEEFSKAFYELIVKQAGLDVKELKNLLKQQDIDTTQSTQTVLNEILNRFSDLRDVLVNKIIEYVAKQFNVIIGEIEQLEIIPKTLLDHLKNQVSQLDPQQILQFVTGTSSTLPNVLTEAYIKNASFLKPGTLTSFTQFRDRIPDAYITRYGHIGYIPGLFDDTRTFTKSIVNTFRYIIAGRLIGEPLLNLMYEAFSSTFETDYELEKARQNLLAKYRGVGVTGKPFEEYAEENIRYRYEHRAELGELGIEEGLYLDPVKRRKLIERMRNQMYDLVDNGIVKALREIAISYGISQPQMATIWQISTRSQENPLNAFAMARAAMTVAAVEREEVKPEDVARAMESIVGQWQIVPGQRTKEGLTLIEKYANMIIKASLESQASAKDLLDVMSRAGAVFNAFLPQNWDKEKKFATALALSNIFIQATGRPGAEAATFFRNLIVAPYAKETMNYLIKLSQSYSDEKIRRVSPFYIEYDKEGRQITRQKDFITYLTDVINAAIRLREIGQVKEADRLLSAVFKTRQFAYEQAFESTFENMFKNFEKEGIKNFEQYIEKIQKVTQEEIDAYIGGLSRTYQFRREQLLSAFQATSMEMINALKPEFHQLMASLKGLLKYVRDNSDEVGKIVKSITEMLTAYFVAYIANKGWTKVKSEVLTNELLAHAEPWLEQEAGLVRRRHELIESTNIKAQNLETFLTLNPEIRTKINEEALKEYIPRYATYQKVSELITQNVQQFMKEFNIQDILGIFSHFDSLIPLIEQRDVLYAQLEEAYKKREALLNSGVTLNPNVLTQVDNIIQSLEKQVADLDTQIRPLRDIYLNLKEQTLAKFSGTSRQALENLWYETEALYKERYQNSKGLSDLYYEIFGKLTDEEKKLFEPIVEDIINTHKQVALIDADLETLNMQLERTRKAYVALGIDENKLNEVLERTKTAIRERVAVEKQAIDRAQAFSRVLDQLNKEFDEGYITANQYRQRLNQISSMSTAEQLDFDKQPSRLSKVLTLGGLLTTKGLSRIFSKIGLLLKTGGKFLGWFTAIQLGLDILSKFAMSEADFKTIDLENLERKIKETTSAQGFGKVIQGVSLALDSITETITNLITGKKSITEAIQEDFLGNLKLIKEGLIGGKSIGELKTELGYEQREREANIALGEERRREVEQLTRDWIDVNKDGIPDIPKDYMTQESVQDFLNRLQETESISLQTNDLQNEIRRVQIIKNGLRQDSNEVINLMKEHYTRQKEILQADVELIEQYQDQIKKALGDNINPLLDPMYRQLELAKLERQQQIAQYDQKIMELYTQVLNRYEQTFGLQEAQLQLDSARKLTSMYVEGVRKDSILYIDEQIKAVRKQYNQIQNEINSLNELLKNPEILAEEKDRIKEQILQREYNLEGLKEQITTLQGSKLQSVMSEYQRRANLLNAEYNIQSALLQARGIDENSTAYQNLERQRLLATNEIIARTINDLKKLMEEANESQREDILIQIRDLEAQSAQNLAAIYKLQKKSIEWGVPAGVKPITQYEYEIQKNTQRGLTLQQGNVYVSVTFDNVYATSKEEIEKNIIEPIMRTITTEVNRQIKRSITVRR